MVNLTSQREAARLMKVDSHLISAATYFHGLETFPHPLNGKARCFDEAGMRKLENVMRVYRENRQRAEMAQAS